MPPTYAERAAPAETGNGPQDRHASTITSNLDDFPCHVEQTEIVEAWRADLVARLARSRLLVNLGLPDPDFQRLVVDVRLFQLARLTASIVEREEGRAA